MPNPRFPVFIVSKGRWESRLTAKALERIGVPFRIIVEPQEYESYAAVISPEKVLRLDMTYKDRYETCDASGDKISKGPGAARNFAWDVSMKEGYTWHWVMDDNIGYFFRLNKNLKVPVADGTIFYAMEDFVLRYENVGMSGPNYDFFAPRKAAIPPFVLNTKIYSCNLIRNDLPFRWRGRFNEDVVLSLDILKAGWCTVQFNAFLQKKTWTQKLKGGNTETYKKEGTLLKSDMMLLTHPDVSRITYRFRRWHHHVDYSGFRQRLRRKPDLDIRDGINNFGMELRHVAK